MLRGVLLNLANAAHHIDHLACIVLDVFLKLGTVLVEDRAARILDDLTYTTVLRRHPTSRTQALRDGLGRRGRPVPDGGRGAR